MEKINLFHQRLDEIKLQTTSTSQIIPIIIGNEKKTMEFSKFLRTNGIFAQAIRYPTVKKIKHESEFQSQDGYQKRNRIFHTNFRKAKKKV